jgi:hypothetical protein
MSTGENFQLWYLEHRRMGWAERSCKGSSQSKKVVLELRRDPFMYLAY